MNKVPKEKVFISHSLVKTSFQTGVISAHFDLMVAVFGEPNESSEDKALIGENMMSMEFDIPEDVDDYDLDESDNEDKSCTNERVRDYEWTILSKSDNRRLGRIYGAFSDSQYCDDEKTNWIVAVDTIPSLSFNPQPVNQELLLKNYAELIEYLAKLIGGKKQISMEVFGPLSFR